MMILYDFYHRLNARWTSFPSSRRLSMDHSGSVASPPPPFSSGGQICASEGYFSTTNRETQTEVFIGPWGTVALVDTLDAQANLSLLVTELEASKELNKQVRTL